MRRFFGLGGGKAGKEEAEEDESPATTDTAREKPFGRIRRALARTGRGIGTVFLGRKVIDDDLLEQLETQLLTADLGIEVTSEVIAALTDRVRRKELGDADALHQALHGLLVDILQPCERPLTITGVDKPFVLLVVGVNGVGKTTTIGKLARQMMADGQSVMLAAGDTFRAAAVEQLQVWGERNRVPVVAQHTGADSASVIYDALESARARGAGVLIADTAGRLHTKSNLMEELRKIKRVLGKLDASAPHEVLLVLDAGTGQNAVVQMQQFHEAVGITGVVLTKLDGTAKGGVIFALCRRFGVPVRYIGVGEGVEDLQPFRADDFVSALLQRDEAP
ncbi:MAG: signal recognition particle-docking protein FtsY [Bacteroidales bacterium]|nr:signal recognition particle-docking protein FtsY [Bacteroidales bacterium]